MLYLITALYAEAKPMIVHFSLKKNHHYIHSTVYENEQITLLITGVGKLSAAIALTELLTQKPPAKHDIVCNIGIAACAEEENVGQLFLCHSITDVSTKRTFYPDLLFLAPCQTASLVTVDQVLTKEQLTQLHTVSSATLFSIIEEFHVVNPSHDTVTSTAFANKQTTDILAKNDTAPRHHQTPVLFDMEAYGICQAALRHFTCERVFFFKVVSDTGTSKEQTASIQPDHMLEPHYSLILSFLEKIETILRNRPENTTLLSAKTSSLAEQFTKRFSLSVSMQNQLKQLLLYGSLLSLPVDSMLKQQLKNAELLPNGKNEGKRQLALFQQKLMNFSETHILSVYQPSINSNNTNIYRANICSKNVHALTSSTTTATKSSVAKIKSSFIAAHTEQHLVCNTTVSNIYTAQTECHSLYHTAFSTIYIEKGLENHPFVQEITTRFPTSNHILISHYKDVFNRSHQNSTLQKYAPALILAAKHGTLLYAGAAVCQSFGNTHFYYTSCSMNCPYDCEYCYLQGMYPSSHLVLFVNVEDYFAELTELLQKHPVYLCASYDTDLLALSHLSHLAVKWSHFVQENPDLTVELRTKSANITALHTLTVSERFILAWTLSPDYVIENWEHKTPSLNARLKAARLAKDLGFPVRLCFDPLLYFPNYKEAYETMLAQVFTYFKPEELYDVSIGVFRCSKDFIKLMRKNRPASALLQYPYENEQGVYHYGTARSEELVQTIKTMLLSYGVKEEKIFLWESNE